MSKKYYLEVTITGRAKVWVDSKEELESFLKDGTKNKEDFLHQAEWEEDELIEWEADTVTKIEEDN